MIITLRVESFAGRNFSMDKLSQTTMAKIKFRGYKLSRLPFLFALFLYFWCSFLVIWNEISRLRRHQVDLSFYGRDRPYFSEKGEKNNTNLVYKFPTCGENIIFVQFLLKIILFSICFNPTERA